PRLIGRVGPQVDGTKRWIGAGVLCLLWIGIYSSSGKGLSFFGAFGAPFDEAKTFNNAFAGPITLNVPVESGGMSGPSASNGPCIVEQLFQSKALAYSPMPDAEPWVQLTLGGN